LPKALFRKSRRIAFDLTLIPNHGQPHRDKKEISRSAPQSGTTHFHADATATVVHKGRRYTLALTRVESGEKMKQIVQRLLAIVRRRGVEIRFLLLDKALFSVERITYWKRAQWGDKQRSARVVICVSSKSDPHKKTGKRRTKNLMSVIWKVRLSPREIRETYRTRFGIETSDRQMNESRIKTCTRDPRLRLLFVGTALVLRNVWVWLHFKLAKGKWSEEPQLFLK